VKTLALALLALTPSVVGEAPNGGGVFRFPQAVAFSPGGGSVIVGDEFSGRISVFGAAGDYRFGFAARAMRREVGRIGVVGGVATDRDGRVYVLDSENDRVQVFDASGTPLASFGDGTLLDLMSGSVDDAAGISASGLAVAQGAPGAPVTIYVVDQGFERVVRVAFDPVTGTFGTPAFSDPGLGLSNPQGIALDPAGTRVYVADDDNDRVIVLDPGSLALLGQVGSHGTGAGQFESPYDVAVDATGRLYVADNLNNRVDVFAAAGLGFLGTFGRGGRGVPGQFAIVRSVGALADDPRGGVAVADTANDRVQSLSPAGAVLAAWGIAGRGAGYVTRARGVAFAPDGGVTVADTFDDRIERFGPDGAYAGQFGLISPSTGYATAGSAAGQLDLPEGVAYDAAGDVWVADTGNDRVVELDPGGAVLRTIGGLSDPRAVATGPGGAVAIADSGHGDVVLLAADGTIAHTYTGLAHPAAVAFAGADVLAADDTHVRDLTTATEIAPPAGAWDHPDGLAAAADGTLYVAELRPGTANGARVLRRSAGTWDTLASEGAGDGQVIDPAGLAVSADGATLLVADAGNDRVLRFDAPGTVPPAPPALSVSVDAFTRGRVTSDPPGIECATDCVQHFGAGRAVTLTATPEAGSIFAGWGGACATTPGPVCTVTIGGPGAVSAAFAPAPVATPAAPPPPPPPPAVRITALHLSTRHLHRTTHAHVTLRLSRPATITIGVQAGRAGRRSGSRCLAPTHALRKRAPCTRYVALHQTRKLARGTGTVTFTLERRFAGRTLAIGSYRLTLTALDSAGNRVGPVTAAFKVSR
jgi:YVTN family beta-propeller protein